MMPLTLLNSGEKAVIIRINKKDGDSPDDNLFRLDEMGLRPGKEIELLQTDSTIILIKIENSRIAVSKQLAFKIFVRKN